MKNSTLLLTSIFLCVQLLLFPFIVRAQNLHIVTSIPPLNALAAGVLENVAEPKLLVPPQASHHHYTLKPSDARALQQADVIVWIGASLESFLQKPINNLTKKTVLTIENLPQLTRYPLRNNKQWEMHDHGHSATNTIDPHVWLDPKNAIVIINAMRNTFSEIDPEHAKQYQTNADKMIQQIQTLDNELKQQLAPVKKVPFLVFHDGYQYLEKYYQLNVVGAVAIDSDLPPSARKLHELHRQIEQEHVVCIFVETTTASPIVATLKRDTDIRVGTLDTLGQGRHFSDFLQLMQFNANNLQECLT